MNDAVIMRTVLDLPEEQVTALAEFCKLQGISRNEAVRRALADMLERSAGEGREKAFGAWDGKSLDASAYVREIREEWKLRRQGS